MTWLTRRIGESRSRYEKKFTLFKYLIFIVVSAIIYLFVFLYITLSTQTSIGNQPISLPKLDDQLRCVVSVTHQWGRLGNRMFLIATGYALARYHSCYLYLSPRILIEMRSVFQFNVHSILLPTWKLQRFHSLKLINLTIACEYLPEFIQPNGIPNGTRFEVDGYWQTYLHFHQYENELREKVFIGRKVLIRKVARFWQGLYREKFNLNIQLMTDDHHTLRKQLIQFYPITWIGIHVRRGDFIPLNYSSNDEYLFNSMKYFIKHYRNVYFLVASDDKKYCENLFRNHTNVFLTPWRFLPGDDLITLSLCQHSIITGGTFGWWTAYLANGQTMHDSVYETGCEKPEHYFPPRFMIEGYNRT